MNYKAIIQDLSDFLNDFDCQRDYTKRGRRNPALKIRTRSSILGDFRRQWGWEVVGEIHQFDKSPATIVNVDSDAPSYIKSLEGKPEKNFLVLQNKIRCEAFRYEAKQVFIKYLLTEIKQLEDNG